MLDRRSQCSGKPYAWARWIHIAIVLVLVVGASGAYGAGEEPAMKPTKLSGITVVSEFTMTRGLSQDITELELARLIPPQDPDRELISLRWVKEQSLFGFESWLLALSGDLVAEGAPTEKQLGRIIPQYDTAYRSYLSYDPATGILSIYIVDLTNEASVYSLQDRVHAFPAKCSDAATGHVVQVIPTFIPAGIEWGVVAGSGADLSRTTLLSFHEEAALEITLQSPRSYETVRLVAEGKGERIDLLEVSLASGTHHIPLDIQSLPPGSWRLRLERVAEGHVLPPDTSRPVRVVEAKVTAHVTEFIRRQGRVHGTLRLSSDGPVQGLDVQVRADIFRMADGEWQLIEEDALLYETKVDVPGVTVEVEFDIGERIAADATHRLVSNVYIPDGRDVALAPARTEHLLYGGETGYMGGIPQIDIAGDTWRRTVIDRIPGYYLGHPDTVLLGDGQTILVVYPLGHGGATVIRRSSDGGKTWSERLPVPENWSRTANVPTIHRLTDPEGTERLIVFQNMTRPGLEVHRDNAEEFFYIAVSEDNGETWTPFTRTALRGKVSPNTVVPISGGRYLTVFQLGVRIQMAITSDGGLTWGEQRSIAYHPDAALVEPAAVKSPDGSEIAVLIRENSRRYNSMLIVSKDEGKTWSAPVELPDTLTGDRHMPRYAPDGRLVITFRDVHPDSPSHTDFVAWVGTYDDLVNLRPGQYRVRLLENKRLFHDTGYAGLEVLPDGTFVATTYVPLYPGERPSVVSVRFTLDELDELVAQQFSQESGGELDRGDE